MVSIASGWYCGRYFQYGKTYRIHPFTLDIDVENGTCSGHGWDFVGMYNLSGICRGSRLAIQKEYVKGTGDFNENKGHQVQLRLEFCQLETYSDGHTHKWGFKGAWEIRLQSYCGHGDMEIWQIGAGALPITEEQAQLEQDSMMDPTYKLKRTISRMRKETEEFRQRYALSNPAAPPQKQSESIPLGILLSEAESDESDQDGKYAVGSS
eukprot:CAMPEP_0203780000 /NCGR_PEP_ID=MMETSP0099_2-20121227/9103_1 /ASSEMBLY_ACC=CAM_ASM_000209 /TAXON_ID=96639 /ORGANISM=" , Strain NY0313808BC1" /LENGTH=208 /DNA_ID=CAMNT_0050680159 /DNA_START=153 /DNA_END=779 /DNA_ORIENTATION=-